MKVKVCKTDCKHYGGEPCKRCLRILPKGMKDRHRLPDRFTPRPRA